MLPAVYYPVIFEKRGEWTVNLTPDPGLAWWWAQRNRYDRVWSWDRPFPLWLAERLRAELAQMRRGHLVGEQIHEAEAAWVVVGDRGAVREMEDDMIVRRVLRARMMECARRRRVDAKRSRHAQVHDEHARVVEIRDEIFRPSRQGFHPPPFETAREILRKGKAEIGAALLDADETPAAHGWFEAPAHGFDFGQLRH